MINNTCFIEVNSVLSNMNHIETSKIPQDIQEKIKEKANNKQIDIQTDKTLEEQISKEALSILTYIILKYVVNNEQKSQLKTSLTQNQLKYEQSQSRIKDIDEIFRKEQIQSLCVIEKENFIKRILKKILKWFK